MLLTGCWFRARRWRSQCAGALVPIREILEAKLVNEYPSAVAGLDVPQARIYGKRLYDDILAAFLALDKEWKI